MSSNLMQCDDGQLLEMLRTEGGITEHQPVIDHVEGCARCQTRLLELAADDDDWRNAAAALSSASDSDKAMDIELEQTVLPRFSHWADRSTEWNESMVKQLLDPPSHPEMLGRLGRFEIECLIGSGGMGIVFKAYDTELHRPVAIKILAPYLASSGSARQRFAREARSGAGIIDDHVVPIHNVESERQPPFLVMQYVAGGSLQEKLDRHGPLDVVEIVRIGVQTAKGLAAAHAQGLIHRDVKPSNILLDEGVERALLTDFGLARAQDDACLTRSGFQPGTPHYMSPEQVRGESIDGRSDLFGLGCVLYALCTGRPPFRADSGYAVLRRITDDTPRPIREINPAIPEWLDQIAMKLLEKDREQRFGSAEEVANTLSQWLAHVQQPHVVPAPAALTPATLNQSGNKSRWMKYLLGAAASLLLLFAGIVIVLETGKGTIRIESEADGVPIRITQGEDAVDNLTVSKSGAGVRVSAGKYVVQVDGQFRGVEVLDGVVTIDKGEQKIIRIVQSHAPTEPAAYALDDHKSVGAATNAPEDRQYLVWEDENQVRLSHWLARSVQLSDVKLRAINGLLCDTWRKYIQLEAKHSEYSQTAQEHLVVKVGGSPPGGQPGDFTLACERLDDEFWANLDRIVSGKQRAFLHALSTRRGDGKGDDTWSSRPKAFPSLLGWQDEWRDVTVEIWTKGTWFHWSVATRQNSTSGEGQTLPPELKHYYVTPIIPVETVPGTVQKTRSVETGDANTEKRNTTGSTTPSHQDTNEEPIASLPRGDTVIPSPQYAPPGLRTALDQLMQDMRQARRHAGRGGPWDEQLGRISPSDDHPQLQWAELWIADSMAFAITAPARDDDGRYLIVKVAAKTTDAGAWEVEHVDVEPAENALREADRFRSEHTDARKMVFPGEPIGAVALDLRFYQRLSQFGVDGFKLFKAEREFQERQDHAARANIDYGLGKGTLSEQEVELANSDLQWIRLSLRQQIVRSVDTLIAHQSDLQKIIDSPPHQDEQRDLQQQMTDLRLCIEQLTTRTDQLRKDIQVQASPHPPNLSPSGGSDESDSNMVPRRAGTAQPTRNAGLLEIESLSKEAIKLAGAVSQPTDVVLSIPTKRGKNLEWKTTVVGNYHVEFTKGIIAIDGGTAKGVLYTLKHGNVASTNYLVFDGSPIPAGEVRIIDASERDVSNTPLIIAEIVQPGADPIPISIELMDPSAQASATFGGIRLTDEMCRINGNASTAGSLVLFVQHTSSAGEEFPTISVPAGGFKVEFRQVSTDDVIGEEMEEVRMIVTTADGKTNEQVISSGELAGRDGKSGKLKIRYAFGDDGPVRDAERVHFADLYFDDQRTLPVFLTYQSANDLELGEGNDSFSERIQGTWKLVRHSRSSEEGTAVGRFSCPT